MLPVIKVILHSLLIGVATCQYILHGQNPYYPQVAQSSSYQAPATPYHYPQSPLPPLPPQQPPFLNQHAFPHAPYLEQAPGKSYSYQPQAPYQSEGYYPRQDYNRNQPNNPEYPTPRQDYNGYPANYPEKPASRHDNYGNQAHYPEYSTPRQNYNGNHANYPESSSQQPYQSSQYTPDTLPNGRSSHEAETHVVYDKDSNLPAFRTNKNETTLVGGDRAAELWEYPYQVQMRNTTFGFICGASLALSPTTGKQVVITAAHCIVQQSGLHRPADSLILRAGSTEVNGNTGQFRAVRKVIVHPDTRRQYNDHIAYDIALLFPDKDFELNHFVKPIRLPSQGQPLRAEYVSIAGFGVGREDGDRSKVSSKLRVVHIPVISLEQCQRQYDGYMGLPGNELITQGHFCAAFKNGGRDTCNGDSGASAVASENGLTYFAGIVSWGKGCADYRYPGVYDMMSNFVDWVGHATKE